MQGDCSGLKSVHLPGTMLRVLLTKNWVSAAAKEGPADSVPPTGEL